MAIQVSNSQIPNSQAAQLTPQAQREACLQALLATAQAGVPESLPLTALRTQAIAIAQEQGFPSTRDEDWRFTDLSSLIAVPFQPPTTMPTVKATALAAVQLPEVSARLVFINGQFSAALSSTETLPNGVAVGSLAQLHNSPLGDQIDVRLGHAGGQQDLFSALNTAGFQDGAVVWVSQFQTVAAPIQILYLSIPQDQPIVSYPRCLVVAEAASTLTLIEDFYGTGTGDHLNTSVTEVWVDDTAQVNHVRLQREGSGTFHIGKTAVSQGRDSRYVTTAISLGARLSRHNLEVTQRGPQTHTELHGLSAIADTQLADTHSLLALTHPHGTAEQRHKCIIDGRAHAVFNGKVEVSRTAQHTNASQINRNLLLSDKARVDTKPELDIVADNVKCAHGATVSQLDDDELFYLQSRGINAEEAQKLLIYGFAMDIIHTIPIPALRDDLMAAVVKAMA
ncbi:Fe-S cluster assembly protein SufD [Leptolyngbya sp. PCC 6406]|uniref:Fe-S cluster assembly protein SufD n=1 Tax=Leptolyngbya sp. PCC 6406 TaxID=1173264 RepID=UPI0002AC5FD8|nr:Fe-S cluster assembly protein SufD [Leptolyngbya sp. PCC 6406]